MADGEATKQKKPDPRRSVLTGASVIGTLLVRPRAADSDTTPVSRLGHQGANLCPRLQAGVEVSPANDKPLSRKPPD